MKTLDKVKDGIKVMNTVFNALYLTDVLKIIFYPSNNIHLIIFILVNHFIINLTENVYLIIC